MRYVYTALGFLLFLAVLGLTLKNTQPVTLYYYLDLSWSAPLVVLLLITFCLGALSGIFAFLSIWVSQRRRLHALKRELKSLRAGSD